MARSPLPPREIGICRRLQIWREQRKIRRTDFAYHLKLRADSYANYEYCRAPVTYGLACKIFSTFNLNPQWLAIDEGPSDVGVPIPSAKELGVSPRALFSEVYDSHLADDIAKKTAAVISSLEYRYGSFEVSGKMTTGGRHYLLETLLRRIEDLAVSVSDADASAFANQICYTASEVAENFKIDEPDVIVARKVALEGHRLAIIQRESELGVHPADVRGRK